MLDRIANYVDKDLLIKVLLVISIGIIILLSFYWEFGLELIELKSTYVETQDALSLSIDPNFVLALITAFCFYIGYRLYASRRLSQAARLQVIENTVEITTKYILVVILGIVGMLIMYFEFSETYVWMYFLPEYVGVSRASQALKINGTIALLLLFIWLVTIKVYSSKRS